MEKQLASGPSSEAIGRAWRPETRPRTPPRRPGAQPARPRPGPVGGASARVVPMPSSRRRARTTTRRARRRSANATRRRRRRPGARRASRRGGRRRGSSARAGRCGAAGGDAGVTRWQMASGGCAAHHPGHRTARAAPVARASPAARPRDGRARAGPEPRPARSAHRSRSRSSAAAASAPRPTSSSTAACGYCSTSASTAPADSRCPGTSTPSSSATPTATTWAALRTSCARADVPRLLLQGHEAADARPGQRGEGLHPRRPRAGARSRRDVPHPRRRGGADAAPRRPLPRLLRDTPALRRRPHAGLHGRPRRLGPADPPRCRPAAPGRRARGAARVDAGRPPAQPRQLRATPAARGQRRRHRRRLRGLPGVQPRPRAGARSAARVGHGGRLDPGAAGTHVAARAQDPRPLPGPRPRRLAQPTSPTRT